MGDNDKDQGVAAVMTFLVNLAVPKMSVEEEIKSWFAETLDSVNATLVEHRTAPYQLRAAMDSYADELQLHGLMEARMVLDGSCAALRDTFSRLTAAHDLTSSDSVFGPTVSGSVSAAPHLADAIRYVQAVRASLKRVNVRVRAMAVLFTSETTWVGLVGGEVAGARDLVAGIFMHWDRALESISKARSEFN